MQYKVIEEFTLPAEEGVSEERVVAVGEIIEVDDETAKTLLDAEIIEAVEDTSNKENEGENNGGNVSDQGGNGVSSPTERE
jgi:hypothetical protein